MLPLKTIYIDVLFLINLYINYFILLSSKRISGLNCKKIRLLLTSFLGAAISVIYFFCSFGLIFDIFFKIFSSVILVITAFGIRPIKKVAKAFLSVLFISLVYAGLFFAITVSFNQPWIVYRSGIIYLNLSVAVIIVMTLVSYSLIAVFDYIITKTGKEGYADLILIAFQKKVLLKAMVDTGNSLKDCFTGKPVIVCEYEAVKNIIPETLKGIFHTDTKKIISNISLIDKKLSGKIRLVPFHTIGGNGLLPCFKPDELSITIGGKTYTTNELYIGVYPKNLSNGEYQAILHPKITNYIIDRGEK